MDLPCPRCGARMAESETEDEWNCPQCGFTNAEEGNTPV